MRSGQEDLFVRVQDLRRLGHEVDAGEDDDVGVGPGRLAGETERVADVVGDVLDVGLLVIVREEDGVLLALQPLDLLEQVERGIDGFADVADIGEEVGGEEVEGLGHRAWGFSRKQRSVERLR